MAFIMDYCYKRSMRFKIKHSEKILFTKKETSSMEQTTRDKAEKVKVVLKQKGEVVLKWLLTAAYLIILIFFVLKPLTDFFLMIEYYIKVNIIKYLIK